VQVQIEERENQGGIIRTLLLDLNIVWHSAWGSVNWRFMDGHIGKIQIVDTHP
jgi:hypothetical protein